MNCWSQLELLGVDAGGGFRDGSVVNLDLLGDALKEDAGCGTGL